MKHTIDADAAELEQILGMLTKPVYRLSEIEPFGLTKTYAEANSGRLKTFTSSGARLVLAADYARYLLMLKREGSIKPSETALSQPARERAREMQRGPRGQRQRRQRGAS